MSARQPYRFTRRTLVGGLLAAGSVSALAGCGWLSDIQPPSKPAPLADAASTPRSSNLPLSQATPVPEPTMAVVAGAPDAYLAVAPKVFRVGQTEDVTVSLLRGQQPASGSVSLALVDSAGKTVAQASGTVAGRSSFGLSVGSAPEGDYRLKMDAASFAAEAPVKVEDGTLLFVETDKPIYKPGQTLHIRILTLDPSLRPVASTATLELADAKGLKVYKREVKTDDLGMASVDVPLSTEPNLGVWKATAKAGKRTAEVDVRVEHYVLPKYEVTVSLPRSWILASDPIQGTVKATYSYGKAVKGDLRIKASRYVGTWQEYANVTKTIDGQVKFELPAPKYSAGVASSGGLGNVQLDVTVTEQETGYEEQTTQLVAVAATPTVLQLIPESVTFKPGLPLNVLVVAQTPDNAPVDADVTLSLTYVKKDVTSTSATQKIPVRGGKALAKITPPSDTISLSIYATDSRTNASTSASFQAGYSPTNSFVHVEQTSPGTVKVGDSAAFHVTATRSGGAFYYEVVALGSLVYSSYTKSQDIRIAVTPQMAPRARLLVYQLTGASEVAADYVPFDVDGTYPQKVDLTVSSAEVKPGDAVEVAVATQGAARVGLAAVDKSVFILAENRLNLQQVFAQLELLYQTPQAELHSLAGGSVGKLGVAVDGAANVAPEVPIGKQGPVGIAPMAPQAMGSGTLTTRGAKDVFSDAGVVILSNQQVPAGEEFKPNVPLFAVPAAVGAARGNAAAAPTAAAGAAPRAEVAKSAADSSAQLADVQRVRQFFPETWVWETFATDASGKATRKYEAPDSITTWMLRAVALSKTTGLGVAEAQLKVFQPSFVQADLPYAAIRGEEFPVQLALYNYGDAAEAFQVDLKGADWFDLLGVATSKVTVQPGNVGAASFRIRPTKLGTNKVEVTARSTKSADAIVKELIIEPEGVAREVVENVVITAGTKKDLAIAFPDGIVDGSGRAYVALTGNYLTQTIQGLDGLLKMPFGCGEQNMILFAPDVFVVRYLKETAQMMPEVMAKGESLMMTGYQRELTYRRGDGSFSAFGNQDQQGSLWLTAFVLKTFSQAKDLIYVDDAVLSSARAWIARYQKADGSFEPVGFVHHQELLGGLQGTAALTAFVAVALDEAGETSAFGKAIRYLEGAYSTASVYALALGAYALGLAKSPKAQAAVQRLMTMAKETEEGLHWGDDPQPVDASTPGGPQLDKGLVPPIGRPGQSAAIETTGYALLALLTAGDKLNASRAARWLVSRRNAYGGFGSTQDTVVGLQALTRYAADSRSDVDATVSLEAGGWSKAVTVAPANADVLQTIDLPSGAGVLTVETSGKGQVVLQTVRRYNVPAEDRPATPIFDLKVDYTANHIEVDDLITVAARIKYTPPEPIAAGMVVLDVAVPTGFAPETSTIDAALKQQPKLKRYDVAGRKVVFYIEDMQPDEQLSITFKARALYPVKAEAVTSQVYSYYRTDWRGESLGGALVVGG